MRRLPFEPPTEYYDHRIEKIDEKICQLIKKRLDVSNNNPGFPPIHLISNWSKNNGLYKELLQTVFLNLLDHEIHKPAVIPQNFRKNKPILKTFEKDDSFYTVTFLRQYENASIVTFHIDKEYKNNLIELPHEIPDYSVFELSIKGGENEYDCRMETGTGSDYYTSYTYIVAPALPDDLTNIELVFTEYKTPYLTKPTGLEIIIKLAN